MKKKSNEASCLYRATRVEAIVARIQSRAICKGNVQSSFSESSPKIVK